MENTMDLCNGEPPQSCWLFDLKDDGIMIEKSERRLIRNMESFFLVICYRIKYQKQDTKLHGYVVWYRYLLLYSPLIWIWWERGGFCSVFSIYKLYHYLDLESFFTYVSGNKTVHPDSRTLSYSKLFLTVP